MTYEDTTATNPTLGPRKSDWDTGIGSAAADELSLIAGGTEVIRGTSKRGATVNGSAVVKGKASFVLTGSIDVTGANTNVPGTGTKFLSELAIGDDILVSGETRTIATITNDTTATVTAAWGSDLANDTSPECNPAAFTVIRDTGAIGAVLDDGGWFGLGTLSPAAPVHIVDDTQNTQLLIDRSSGQFKIEQNTAHTTAQTNVNLRLGSGDTVRVMLLSGGNVGVGTTAPGQIFDVNQGSGNMIADGYDTHSLASYKENLSTAGPGYLAKVTACPPKQWTSVPYVSADEIKVATIEQFGQDAWGEYFPEDDSHRAGALLSMPEGEMKTWIDAWAESRRQERRPEEKWQQVRLGLVADAEDTAASFSESIAKNDSGEISGINTMSYIGTLHAAIVELAAKVAALEGES